MAMTLMRATTTIAELGERGLVTRITTALAQPRWVIVGPGDDAAVLEQEPRTLEVLTTDALVEGVHFDRRFTPPDAIGHRALAVNLSDLAAMGARPRAALLSLILPGSTLVADVDAMIAGMTSLAAREHIAIVGGNVTSTPGPLTVDVTVTGNIHRRRVLRRGGARVGDDVFVTGGLGAAAVGLWSLQQTIGERPTDERAALDERDAAEARERYLRPSPRVHVGRALAGARAASACIDLSDGLGDGVRRLAEASNVGIALDGNAIPIAPAMRQWYDGDSARALDAVLRSGDDYELLFTSSPRARGRLRAARRLMGDVPIARIGTITKGRGLCVRTAAGERPVPDGFAHFG